MTMNPKGSQQLAGGRRRRTTGISEKMQPHPGGMPAITVLASRWDAIHSYHASGGIASLDHWLIAANPLGSKLKTSENEPLQNDTAALVQFDWLEG